jgi:hypothetical protein
MRMAAVGSLQSMVAKKAESVVEAAVVEPGATITGPLDSQST